MIIRRQEKKEFEFSKMVKFYSIVVIVSVGIIIIKVINLAPTIPPVEVKTVIAEVPISPTTEPTTIPEVTPITSRIVLVSRGDVDRKVESTKKAIIHNERIDKIVAKASIKYDVDEYMIHAIIKQESDYDSKSLSYAGACGLMQLMPATARIFGVYGKEIWDDEKNIDAGTHYYKDLLKQFNNIRLALAGYNAGGEAVKKYGNNIPPYEQTQEYVPAVLRHYKNIKAKLGVG